jgi:hypothetical protein
MEKEMILFTIFLFFVYYILHFLFDVVFIKKKVKLNFF